MRKIKIIGYIIFIGLVTFVGCSSQTNDKIEQMLDSMTLEEKIGQMILSGFSGSSIDEELKSLIKEEKVGGLILFKRNIQTSSDLKVLIQNINDINENIPLFISIDEEGGRVTRLPESEDFPSVLEIGNTEDEKYSYEQGRLLGKTLKEYGINMDHAPVLDIYSNPQNTVIGDRAFGSNDEIVSKMGIAMMNGIKDEGIIPTVKHFPGHGDTEVDSHVGLPIVNKTLEELMEFEFVPFKEAIDNECDVIMVSHIVLNKIDSKNPATLSKSVISDVLREKLSFNKVIMTDDMNMSAITNTINVEDASVESIKAGCDIILIGSGGNYVKSTIEKIKESIEKGEITENRIDESVYRILELKQNYLLMD